MSESERTILSHIDELVAEEHDLRSRHGSGGLSDEERQRMTQLEVELDRAWDLLRQRRARSEFGANPDGAQERPAGEVETYLQ
jgi:Rad3-related DNA helicase